MTDPLLQCIEVEPPDKASHSIIWLHGLGADGHDFESIVPMLNLPDIDQIRFVFPHAPERVITANGGLVMRGWYDLYSWSIQRDPDTAGILESCRAVQRLVNREIERGINASRIILAGFSQGGVIALEAASRFSGVVGGVIALSTYLPLVNTFPACRENMPIFWGHGELDDIVPLSQGQRAVSGLLAKGYPVEWKTYPMAHSVCMEEIADISHWLQARLA